MKDLFQALVNMSEQMKKLADNLSDKGRKLTPWENQLCRIAYIPAIQECFEMTISGFLTGRNIEREVERLQELLLSE